jgi:hypothetical protein
MLKMIDFRAGCRFLLEPVRPARVDVRDDEMQVGVAPFRAETVQGLCGDELAQCPAVRPVECVARAALRVLDPEPEPVEEVVGGAGLEAEFIENVAQQRVFHGACVDGRHQADELAAGSGADSDAAAFHKVVGVETWRRQRQCSARFG